VGRARGSYFEDILGDIHVNKSNIWFLSESRYSELSRSCMVFYVARLTNSLIAISLRRIDGSYTASCVLTEVGF